MTGLPKHLRLKAAAPVFQGAGLRDWQLTVLLRSPSRGDREILRRAFQNGAASGQEAEGAVLLTFLLGQMKSFLAGQVADFRQAPATAELHGFLADFPPVRQWIWEVKGRRISLRERTLIMGVINVTPDSFSDGGRYISAGRAVEHGLSLAEAGADILDVGGESTRPGAEPVPEAEERRRVLPVIEKLKAQTDLLISVDTYKASVARAAVEAGADIVNDISGFHFDPEMAGVVAESGAGAVLMHIRGTPRNMQQNPQYSDVIEEILAYLEEGMAFAREAGCPPERLVVDPGIGFGKRWFDNYDIINRLQEFWILNRPLLVGASRKSFLGKFLDAKPEERVSGTLAAHALAISRGARIVRVHDVREARQAARIADIFWLRAVGMAPENVEEAVHG